jgi:hypothetical protein
MAILGPKPEGQEYDMRVRRPSGGCDVHQRTEADLRGLISHDAVCGQILPSLARTPWSGGTTIVPSWPRATLKEYGFRK